MEDDPKDDKKKAPQDDNEAPVIYSVSHVDGQPRLSRRTFLEIAAITAGSSVLSIGGGMPVKQNRGGATTSSAHKSPSRAHNESVTAIAVNSTGLLLASGDKGGVLKLWQLPEGALLHSWPGHNHPVAGLSFPQMENELWSLDSSGALKRWSLPAGKDITGGKFVPENQKGGYLFAVPGVGDWYAVKTSAGGVELRRQTTGELLLSIEGLDDEVKALAATLDGRLLLVGGAHGNLGLWTVPTGTRMNIAKTGTAAVSALTIAPNGTMAVTAHANSQLRTWQMPELQPGAVYESSPGKPFCVAIRPQLDLFVAGTEKPQIGVWKIDAAAAAPQTLAGHTAAVRATVITPDGSLLISGSDDKTIRLWSLPDGQYLRNLVDLAINYKTVEGTSYKGTDIYGRSITFTLPCGSPIPPGAVCICNCVPGAMAVPKNYSQNFNVQGYCTCDLICTCNTICTCQSICTCQGVGGRYVSYWYPN